MSIHMDGTATYRMMLERPELEEDNPHYKVFFSDNNLLSFQALAPPKVLFDQHRPHITHPRFLPKNGPVTLDILRVGHWCSSFNIRTVLDAIYAHLDYDPHKYSLFTINTPQYARFVQYITWRSLLADRILLETRSDVKSFIKKFVQSNAQSIIVNLIIEKLVNMDLEYFTTPYYRRGRVFLADYDTLITDMRVALALAQTWD
ncbi:UBC-like protein [Xylaria sp. FL1777]|nr:UBC-like protein [Xylaria sp. FL1777]